MRIEFSGTGEVNGAFFKSMQELAESQWPAELKRMQSLSLITGGEILYDISGFGVPARGEKANIRLRMAKPTTEAVSTNRNAWGG